VRLIDSPAKLRHGLTDNVGLPDDDRVQTDEILAERVLQKHHADDHGAFIKLLEAHRVAPAVSLMRKHLSNVEESLNFNRHARDPLDLRSVYAPNSRG
jgi:hypothetical protein